MATPKQDTTEARIQQDCYIWFHNSFPDLRGCLFAVPNGIPIPSEHEGFQAWVISKFKKWAAKKGQKLKFTGTHKGVSDLVFCYNGVTTFIEMKTATGRQSDAQKEWEKAINSQGFEYVLCRTQKHFEEIVKGVVKYGCYSDSLC
tara:strand:+ start:3200 stop:3634 length:435 start_codon:yes stop_codon:yes gene_type:complete